MSVSQLIIRLVIFTVIIIGLHLIVKEFNAPKKKIKSVFILHIFVLSLFFSGVFGSIVLNPVTDLLLDMVWWTMALIGAKTCFSHSNHFSKMDYIIVLTTFIFLGFIPLMMLMTNM